MVSGTDPCLTGNHQVIADQPERSFNHHLSVGSGVPVCDSELQPGWYTFQSPAGDLLPTECPGGNYCGPQVPVWMKGKQIKSTVLLCCNAVIFSFVLVGADWAPYNVHCCFCQFFAWTERYHIHR